MGGAVRGGDGKDWVGWFGGKGLDEWIRLC